MNTSSVLVDGEHPVQQRHKSKRSQAAFRSLCITLFFGWVMIVALSDSKTSFAQGNVPLASDLTLIINCSEDGWSSFESQFILGLRSKGFDAVDLSQRQNMAFGHSTTRYNVVAINSLKDHLAKVYSSPVFPGEYYVFLVTRPPTRRDVNLESYVIDLIGAIQSCVLRQQDRSENSIDALPSFNRESARVDALLAGSRH